MPISLPITLQHKLPILLPLRLPLILPFTLPFRLPIPACQLWLTSSRLHAQVRCHEGLTVAVPVEVAGHLADAVGNGAAAVSTLGLLLDWGCGEKAQPVGQLACSLPPKYHKIYLSRKIWLSCKSMGFGFCDKSRTKLERVLTHEVMLGHGPTVHTSDMLFGVRWSEAAVFCWPTATMTKSPQPISTLAAVVGTAGCRPACKQQLQNLTMQQQEWWMQYCCKAE